MAILNYKQTSKKEEKSMAEEAKTTEGNENGEGKEESDEIEISFKGVGVCNDNDPFAEDPKKKNQAYF